MLLREHVSPVDRRRQRGGRQVGFSESLRLPQRCARQGQQTVGTEGQMSSRMLTALCVCLSSTHRRLAIVVAVQHRTGQMISMRALTYGQLKIGAESYGRPPFEAASLPSRVQRPSAVYRWLALPIAST